MAKTSEVDIRLQGVFRCAALFETAVMPALS